MQQGVYLHARAHRPGGARRVVTWRRHQTPHAREARVSALQTRIDIANAP
jgi:hypothetical protein